MNRRKVQSAGQNLHQLFAVVCNAAARATQSEAGPDQHRETELRGKLQAVAQVVHQRRLRNLEADAQHGVLEEQPVLGLLDGLELGADQLDVVLVENPRIGQFDREIERRLSAHGGQKGELAGAVYACGV